MPGGTAHRGLLVLLALATTWIATGCGDSADPEVPLAPEDCIDTAPLTGDYGVQVTIDSRFAEVPIAIFRNEIEGGDIVLRDTLTTSEVFYELTVDVQYVTTALYVVGADTILVVDESKIKEIKTDFRDKSCYSTQSALADVRLKVTP